MVEFLDDVCSDMSVFHGVRDINTLSGSTFFKLAYRLDAYEGAYQRMINLAAQEVQAMKESGSPLYSGAESPPPSSPERRAMTAEELNAWDPGPSPALGHNVGLFDFGGASA